MTHLPDDSLPACPPECGLRLRHFQASDLGRLVRMHREAALQALLIDPLPLHRRALAHDFLTRLQFFYARFPGLGAWAAEQKLAVTRPLEATSKPPSGKSSGESATLIPRAAVRFVGWFTLIPIPELPEELELGCRLLPSAWGSRASALGAAALLEHAFERLQRQAVWAFCHPAHRSARFRLHELGFRLAGTTRYQASAAAAFIIERSTWQQQMVWPPGQRRRSAWKALMHSAARSPEFVLDRTASSLAFAAKDGARTTLSAKAVRKTAGQTSGAREVGAVLPAEEGASKDPAPRDRAQGDPAQGKRPGIRKSGDPT